MAMRLLPDEIVRVRQWAVQLVLDKDVPDDIADARVVAATAAVLSDAVLAGLAEPVAPRLVGLQRDDLLDHDQRQSLARKMCRVVARAFGAPWHGSSSIGSSTAPMAAEGGRVGNDPSAEDAR